MSGNKQIQPIQGTVLEVAHTSRSVDIYEGVSAKGVEERLKKQAELRNAFLRFVKQSMRRDTHYMPAQHRGAQPYLKQEGALLLVHFWQCENDYLTEKETDTDNLYAVTIKCLLRHPSGNVYVGLGWASSKERNYETRLAREGLGTLKETIGQMARKRALVSAARHLPFVSELFTSESENGSDKGASRASSGNKPEGGGIAKDSEEAIKEKHKRRLRVLMQWASEEWKTDDDEEIKKRLTAIVHKEVNSKSMFVTDDDLWERFSIHIGDIQAERAHG